MNSIKCKSCGLTNFPSDVECRRCGYSFVQSSSQKRKDKPPRSFSLWSIVMIALVAGVGYCIYTNYFGSTADGTRGDAKQATSQPAAGLSRTEHDKQRSGHYGNAVANSASLKAHQQNIDRTEKAIQQVSNSK